MALRQYTRQKGYCGCRAVHARSWACQTGPLCGGITEPSWDCNATTRCSPAGWPSQRHGRTDPAQSRACVCRSTSSRSPSREQSRCDSNGDGSSCVLRHGISLATPSTASFRRPSRRTPLYQSFWVAGLAALLRNAGVTVLQPPMSPTLGG